MVVKTKHRAPLRQPSRLQISIAGGDTDKSRNLAKRIAIVAELTGELTNKYVLDCGCGTGSFTRAYGEMGARAIGIEYSRAKLRARRHTDTATFVVADISQLPLRDRSFDVVVFNEVLEHVPDDAQALREAFRVLKRDGMLIVMSPNRLYPFETHGVSLKRLGTRLPAHTPFVPYVPLSLGTHIFDYWARNYWPWQLRSQLQVAGFEILHTGFVTQTLENISGTQPRWLRAAAPALRLLLAGLERVPGVSALVAVSQLIAARPRGSISHAR